MESPPTRQWPREPGAETAVYYSTYPAGQEACLMPHLLADQEEHPSHVPGQTEIPLGVERRNVEKPRLRQRGPNLRLRVAALPQRQIGPAPGASLPAQHGDLVPPHLLLRAVARAD